MCHVGLWRRSSVHAYVTHVSSRPCARRYRWVVQGNWKLIVPHSANEKGPVELFDLEKDPHETENLAVRLPDKVAALSAKLDAWWKP